MFGTLDYSDHLSKFFYQYIIIHFFQIHGTKYCILSLTLLCDLYYSTLFITYACYNAGFSNRKLNLFNNRINRYENSYRNYSLTIPKII